MSRAATIPVVDPATEQRIADVPAGSAADVDRAVDAARRALAGWSATPAVRRAELLAALADAVERDAESLAELLTRDVGTPIRQSRDLQVGMPLHNLRAYAELAAAYDFAGERVGNSLVVREPVGVVACITPWNFPLHQIVLKAAPAFAAGCTVVLKPSEIAPLAAFALAELIDAAGFPPGVFNLVCGTGEDVGEPLAAHPGVDMVSLTGSTRAGTRVAALAAPTVKKVALELGGKSAAVVLEGADLERAVSEVTEQSFLNAGQNCAALSRLLVPRARLAAAEEIAAAVARAVVTGDPADDATTLGPLVSEAQLARVRALVDSGGSEGAVAIAGGSRPVRDTGWFHAPTVLSRVRPEMRVAREEIFGPVLALLPYDDEDEAVEIANGTEYGLFASVWAPDEERGLACARRLQAGQVQVNGGAFNLDAPFGGYKRSGLGREGGRWGLEELLEVKAIHL